MTLRGGRELNRRFDAIADTSHLMRAVQLETIAGAKARVPRKTGFLGRSIVPGNVDDDSAVVFVNAPYAAAVEFGSKPHVIRPKRARMLAWPANPSDRRLSGRARKGVGAADLVFAGKVNHPGTKPQPYVRPAAEEAVKRNGVDAIVKVWNESA